MKKLFFLLVLIISFSGWARANWSPYIMSHERFMTLSDTEKEIIIVKTMQLMVELESQYHSEKEVSALSPERERHFVNAIKKLNEFFISSAYAADPKVPWADQAKAFDNLYNISDKSSIKPKFKPCIYSGFVSKISKSSNGKDVCVHPQKSGHPLIEKAYNAVASGCKGPEMIACNPMVFGYESGDATFCVETGFSGKYQGNKAHNVSYECSRLALGEGKEDRIKQIAEGMASTDKNTADGFNAVQKTIFRTCACGDNGKGVASKFNQGYIDYMRPHRTCWGLLKSMHTMSYGECLALAPENSTTTFAKEFSDFFSAEMSPAVDIPSSRVPTEFDSKYAELIKKPEVQRYCDEIKEEEPVTCNVESEITKDESGKNIVTLSISLPEGKTGSDIKWPSDKFTPVDPKNPAVVSFAEWDGKEFKAEASVKVDGKELKCPIAIAPEAVACSVDTKIDEKDGKKSITLSVKLPEGKTATAITWPDPAKFTAADPKVPGVVTYADWDGKELKGEAKAKISDTEELVCPFAVTPPADEGAPCSIEHSEVPGADGKIGLALIAKPAEGKKFDENSLVWGEGYVADAADKTKAVYAGWDQKAFEPVVKAKIAGKDVECKGSVPAKESSDGAGSTITLTPAPTQPNPNQLVINAAVSINIDGKVVTELGSDYWIVYNNSPVTAPEKVQEEKKKKEKKKKKKEKSKKQEDAKPDQGDGTDGKTEDKTEEENVVEEVDPDIGQDAPAGSRDPVQAMSVTENRPVAPAVTQTCALLLNKEKKVMAKSNCVPVEPISQMPNMNPNMGGPGQMGPPGRSLNTSAIGI